MKIDERNDAELDEPTKTSSSKRFKTNHKTFQLKTNDFEHLQYNNETNLYESNLFKLQVCFYSKKY